MITVERSARLLEATNTTALKTFQDHVALVDYLREQRGGNLDAADAEKTAKSLEKVREAERAHQLALAAYKKTAFAAQQEKALAERNERIAARAPDGQRTLEKLREAALLADGAVSKQQECQVKLEVELRAAEAKMADANPDDRAEYAARVSALAEIAARVAASRARLTSFRSASVKDHKILDEAERLEKHRAAWATCDDLAVCADQFTKLAQAANQQLTALRDEAFKLTEIALRAHWAVPEGERDGVPAPSSIPLGSLFGPRGLPDPLAAAAFVLQELRKREEP